MDFSARHNLPNGPLHRKRRFSASGLLTPLLVAVLCIVLLVLSYNHKLGNLHRLRTAVLPREQAPPLTIVGPGGQAPIYLSRAATSLGEYPEFLSVTLLPGRGMEVLQITASIPGRGEVPLLRAPAVADAAQKLTGTGNDANGRLGATLGGAFLAPWSGRLTGAPSSQNGMLETSWDGHRLLFPAETAGTPGTTSDESIQGLLLDRAADSVSTGVLADGQSAQAFFRLGSFHGAWPSSLDLATSVQLSGHSITLMMTAKNVGTSPLPIGLGWKPYFAIPSGDRADATLVIPASERVVTDSATGLPTGAVADVNGTPFDLENADGTALGQLSINATYTELHSAALADGPILELRDPAANYGLRVIPISDSIGAVQVDAPSGEPWVSLDPETNITDPLGREWNSSLDGSGMKTLAPGQSLVWQVRLEIFAVSGSGKLLTP